MRDTPPTHAFHPDSARGLDDPAGDKVEAVASHVTSTLQPSGGASRRLQGSRHIRRGRFNLPRAAAVAALAWGVAWAANRSLRRVEGASMLPSLWPDDLLLTLPAGVVTPRVGDVVVATVAGRAVTKRLAGVGPGQVRLLDGHLWADGTWWSDPDTIRADEEVRWDLDTGEVLLLGDHRGESTDSRTIGPMPAAAVTRVAVAAVRPWRWLRDRVRPLDGTRDRPGVRLVVLDPDDRVLAFRVTDTDGGPDTWWEAPGGGRHDGETASAAARRELAEEVGVAGGEPVPLGTVHVRDTTLGGAPYRKVEDVLAVRMLDAAVDEAGWTDAERRDIVEHRWWTVDELDILASDSGVVVPADLADLARRARQVV